MLARLSNILHVSVQAVDKIAVVGAQRAGECSAAAADMDDQPAFDAGVAQDLSGFLLL